MVDPAERAVWDERILGEVTSTGTPRNRRSTKPRHAAGSAAREAESAQAGRRVRSETAEPLRRTRWRFKLGNVPMVMRDEILAAHRHDRLISRIRVGSMHFDQTLTLHTEDDETGPRTRLGMKIVAHNSIAVIGEVVPRLDVQKLIIEYVDTTLRQVQKHCEGEA